MVLYCSQSVSGFSENDLGQHNFLNYYLVLTEAKQITASMNHWTTMATQGSCWSDAEIEG